MKQLISMICFCLMFVSGFSQASEGRIIYENTSQLRVQFANRSMANAELEKAIPKVQVRSFELLFGNNQSVWQSLPDARQEADQMGQTEAGRSVLFKSIISSGREEITYFNFNSGRKVVSRELNAQKYLIEDTITKSRWQLQEAHKKILGFQAQKAVAEIYSKRAVMEMENGEMIRKEVPDTILVTAWFTTDLPIPAGPVYQGQLPGVILELDINNGQSVYKAVEFSPKVNLAKIKEPKGGKKVTQQLYEIEAGKAVEASLKRITENRGQIIHQQ